MGIHMVVVPYDALKFADKKVTRRAAAKTASECRQSSSTLPSDPLGIYRGSVSPGRRMSSNPRITNTAPRRSSTPLQWTHRCEPPSITCVGCRALIYANGHERNCVEGIPEISER
jgi:hypothetical protein